jgi:hypothetical protein
VSYELLDPSVERGVFASVYYPPDNSILILFGCTYNPQTEITSYFDNIVKLNFSNPMQTPKVETPIANLLYNGSALQSAVVATKTGVTNPPVILYGGITYYHYKSD